MKYLHFEANFPSLSTLGDIWLQEHPPVALPSLLPEQITEAVLPWEQSGPPRTVTGQLHRKDSAPEQWNQTVEIWSPPSIKCDPLGVEMATPQPSWQQTTLALARVQWEAQSTLHCPEMFISTCPPHWEEPFVMSRTSEYAGRRQDFSKISRFLTWTDNLNSSTVVTSGPWTGHSGTELELRLLPFTPELFSPDLAIWLSEGHVSQDRPSYAASQFCTDDLGNGECKVPIRHWGPLFSRMYFYSPWAGSIPFNQTNKS